LALVYLVEDDAEVAQRVCALLQREAHEALWFSAPHQLFHELQKRTPGCVLVDWVLPELPGIDVVARVRELLGHKVGILMLTAMNSEDSVVAALETGADDYVTKPFADAVLLARVGALLRRLTPRSAPPKVLVVGPYRFDFAMQTACVNDTPIQMTPREFDLAWMLFSQPVRLFTKQDLQAAIWGKNSTYGFHTVAQHVYSVRKKLALAQNGVRLVAVYASGYRLELPEGWLASASGSQRNAQPEAPNPDA
jgi:DNA-binding response OmpR family regulator